MRSSSANRFTPPFCSDSDLPVSTPREHRIRWQHLLLAATILFGSVLPAKAQQSVPPNAGKDAGALPVAATPVTFGSTPPEKLTPVFKETKATNWLADHRVRVYGWLDGGYTYASSGDHLLKIAPTPDRFGNEMILNGVWMIVDRPLSTQGWSWGFRSDFYAGADAALLRPMNSFGPQQKRLGTDFRQAYVSVHMPVLTKGGVDVLMGRQNVPLGFESLMGPYRPMYSQTYYWIYYQVGSTSVISTLHANNKLDLVGGVVMGYNTVFEMRGRAPDYLAKAIYKPTKKTTLIGAVYTGPKPTGTATGHVGDWLTVMELQARREWTPRLSQAVLVTSWWDRNDPGAHHDTSAMHGVSMFSTYHVTPKLDINNREEWFLDGNGARTGVDGHFGAATLGLNVMPEHWINFRPEIRGDFAEHPAFGPVTATRHDRNQLTVAFDLIFKFSAIR